MANRAFLLSHDSATPLAESEGAIAAAANYQVPILWLSLFVTGDLRLIEVPLEDFDGNPTRGLIPTVHTSAESARRNYRARRESLLARIPAALHKHCQEWEVLLDGLSGTFVQIDVGEIWMMQGEEGEFEEA